MSIITLLWLIQGACGLIISDGVIFSWKADIHTSRSQWRLTLLEDMDYCSPGLELAQRQFNDLHTTLSSVSERIKSGKAVIVHKGQWQKNFKQLLGGLEEIKTKVGELTREYGEFKKLEGNRTGRKERSILPIIGKLSSSLFGTVSEEELELVNRNLHRVADKQKVLTHITQESLSLVNMSRVEIKANRNKLNKAIEEINRLGKEIVDVEAVSKNTWESI